MRIALVIGGLLLAAVLLNLQCLGYITHVSYNQLKLIYDRRPIPEVLEDPAVDELTKKRLKLIPQVQKFAVDKLYLHNSKSYHYYARIDRPFVVYNVSACEPLKFEAYTWYFPIAGTVPYKGYFEKQMAVDEAADLKKEGYDVRVRGASAYSTLGWFDDPVLSSFLRGKENSLIALIFHEMAHATFYIAGDTRFNESFASFVEKQGMLTWFEAYFGKNSKELQEWQDSKYDARLLISEMKATARQLDNLYRSKAADSEKLVKKKEIIDDLKNRALNGKIAFKNENYKKYFEHELNNTYFQSILRYESGDASFSRLYEKSGDMKTFLAEVDKMKDWDALQRAEFLDEK